MAYKVAGTDVHKKVDRVRLHGQIECLLEEMRIKLSVVVADLFGASGLRILHAIAEGQTDAECLAKLGDERLRCPRERLIEAVTGRSHPTHRKMLASARLLRIVPYLLYCASVTCSSQSTTLPSFFS